MMNALSCLSTTLVACLVLAAVPARGGEAKPVVPLSTEACWQAMPAVASGGGQPLPIWARAVATQLPRTAAAMLELDLAQRTQSPIDPVLRAKMRWVIAHANHSSYGEAYSLADLVRAGGTEADVKSLTGDPAARAEEDREPLEFARLLTVAAPTIDDAMFARLVDRFGPKKTAAMVLLAAYGNFQDRIVLGLGLDVEEGGPLAPVEVKFAPGGLQIIPVATEAAPRAELVKEGRTVVERDPEWSELSYDELQSRLEAQRGRKPRLPIPTWDEVKKNLPPELADRPFKIVWTLLCMGYVPELAMPWNQATRTMWVEAKLDRLREESLFWIQTRSIRCNYCMGHCEMLMEVAGLDKDAIADRTRKLASDDWSAFPAQEQRAFAYARKLTKSPWQLTASDYQTLSDDLGPREAMGTIFWLCRGLYMTRVSDGFQLPLERENVFSNFFRPSTSATKPSGGR